jgi:hypothetical protein
MELPCSGGRHEVRWERGHLVLTAHTDVEAEQALRALGGAAPACLALRAAWSAWQDDPVLVTLGRRPGEAGLGFTPDDAPPTATTLHTPPLRRRSIDPSATARREDLVRLLSLPVAFIDRLVLTAMAAAADRWAEPGFRDRHGLRLGASLAARSAPALRRLAAPLAEAAGIGEITVHCTPAPPHGRALITAERRGTSLEVSASLPLDWLPRVWGPGLSEPDGRFVLARRSTYGVDVVEWADAGNGRWEGLRRPAELVRDDDAAPWRVVLAGDGA